MRFALALHSDDGVRYGATVPDLPGCFSAGDTLDDAIAMAREAIDAHCELLASDGAPLPAPRPLADLQADAEFAGAVWAIVDVPVEAHYGPSERVNITLPAAVLRRIDEHARAHGESRSGFLLRAAQAAMITDA